MEPLIQAKDTQYELDMGGGPLDDIDKATLTEAMERNMGLREMGYHQLMQMARALEKIDEGTYGTCDVCGRKISAKRLIAMPYAMLCLMDKRLLEATRSRHGPPRPNVDYPEAYSPSLGMSVDRFAGG